MTFCASAGAIEITHPSLGVSGLQVGNINGTSAAFLCVCLTVMDECNQRRELLIVYIAKRRHPFGKPPVPNRQSDFVSMRVLLNERRRRQVRTAFATSGVASVAEAALRSEQSLASLYLLGRGRG